MSDVLVSSLQLLREQCAADDAMCELQCALAKLEDDMLERGIVSLDQRIRERGNAAQAHYDLKRILPGLEPVPALPMNDRPRPAEEFEPGFVRRSRFF